jgi:hypothetical protein
MLLSNILTISVIIDSKVSLNAFLRHVDATNKEEQSKELQSHVSAIRTHIVSLSSKGYDDYDKALDFVMMFIPSEPAYIAALQGDSNLWNFAYEKRILLISPQFNHFHKLFRFMEKRIPSKCQKLQIVALKLYDIREFCYQFRNCWRFYQKRFKLKGLSKQLLQETTIYWYKLNQKPRCQKQKKT